MLNKCWLIIGIILDWSIQLFFINVDQSACVHWLVTSSSWKRWLLRLVLGERQAPEAADPAVYVSRVAPVGLDYADQSISAYG